MKFLSDICGVKPLSGFMVPLLLLCIIQNVAAVNGSVNETGNLKFEHGKFTDCLLL